MFKMWFGVYDSWENSSKINGAQKQQLLLFEPSQKKNENTKFWCGQAKQLKFPQNNKQRQGVSIVLTRRCEELFAPSSRRQDVNMSNTLTDSVFTLWGEMNSSNLKQIPPWDDLWHSTLKKIVHKPDSCHLALWLQTSWAAFSWVSFFSPKLNFTSRFRSHLKYLCRPLPDEAD